MASVVDICNLALAHLGDDATVSTIDPPEGSAQAEHCARFYPIARDALLELHDWKFATRRASLSKLTAESWNWAAAYAAPTQALRILAVIPADASSDTESEDYEIEAAEDGSSIILTNTDLPTARFTMRAEDPSRYPPLFVEALARLLASYLAGPLIKGDAGVSMARSKYQEFMLVLSQAKVSDANQQKHRPEHSPSWIKGR